MNCPYIEEKRKAQGRRGRGIALGAFLKFLSGVGAWTRQQQAAPLRDFP